MPIQSNKNQSLFLKMSEKALAISPAGTATTPKLMNMIVLTNKANYYISIPVESCILNSKTYYCISAQSPIGSSLIGKKVGDSIQFNNQMIHIEELI